uniref:Uncharacterized protein n=1 Tax=viral metagenome TaxID=1070528 RepID=A0A6C0ETC1_9ZZZZ
MKGKTKGNKTNKRNKSNKHIIILCIDFLNNLKLFHWNTKSYALHISSDILYEELYKSVDRLVESFLQNRIPINTTISISTNPNYFLNKMKLFKKCMNEMDVSNELLSLKDDILVSLDQFEYRLTLKE